MKEHSDKKSEAREGCRGKHQAFKKKKGKHKKPQSMEMSSSGEWDSVLV